METKVGDLDCFAIEPITNCPHVTSNHYKTFTKFLMNSLTYYNQSDNVFNLCPCLNCHQLIENWICLQCGQTYCSRYQKGHMALHNAETSHEIAQSFSDGSFWCYTCDSYITNKNLDRLRKIFGHIKHHLVIESRLHFEDDLELNEVIKKLTELNLKSENKNFSLEKLAEGLKNKSFKKICAITGAGISVAAGIPDFRSPGGLYHQLAEEYGMSTPEEIMTLKFFHKNPEPLYKIMKEFIEVAGNLKPTLCHKFMGYLSQNNLLSKYYTQNVDGLEFEAGIKADDMLQAHGQVKSCSCSNLKCKGILTP